MSCDVKHININRPSKFYLFLFIFPNKNETTSIIRLMYSATIYNSINTLFVLLIISCETKWSRNSSNWMVLVEFYVWYYMKILGTQFWFSFPGMSAIAAHPWKTKNHLDYDLIQTLNLGSASVNVMINVMIIAHIE